MKRKYFWMNVCCYASYAFACGCFIYIMIKLFSEFTLGDASLEKLIGVLAILFIFFILLLIINIKNPNFNKHNNSHSNERHIAS